MRDSRALKKLAVRLYQLDKAFRIVLVPCSGCVVGAGVVGIVFAGNIVSLVCSAAVVLLGAVILGFSIVLLSGNFGRRAEKHMRCAENLAIVEVLEDDDGV